ncbi:ParB/Srx family N-terminal domain-containing protein [Clostridium saudiense]|uniref:ParB/Srx family N-terminal domain-containing protein n=1 Tax=Clostridium saudiense TaxID=1414720 RepID=UPI0004BA8362|nr:ParB/Srx family N-terminal domain-containing protein [Clostridium saudiense]
MDDGILLKKLKPEVIEIEKLLLDANNPRFSAVKNRVANNRMDDEKIQGGTLTNIRKFGVDKLKDSIENVGFLPIDRIVVVKLTDDSEFYVVIEGNRRIAAVKSILEDIEDGKEVKEDILNSLKQINVLTISDKTYETSSDFQLLIQGLRHISGIKQWKPYQQARALVSLVDELNYNITKAAGTLGLGRNNASWMRKAFYAFENMRKHEELELPKDEKLVSYFSYFVEVLKDVNLRQYFGWDDSINEFSNNDEVLKLYKWIGIYDPNNEDEDRDETQKRQIPGALDIRKLYKVLIDDEAKGILEVGGNIDLAYSKTNRNAVVKVDYSKVLKDMYKTLDNLPSRFVKNMNEEDKEILTSIIEIAGEHLQ